MPSYSNVSFNELGSGKTRYKDLFDVTAGYAEERPFAVAKAIYVAIDLLKHIGLVPEGKEEAFDNIGYHAKLVKLSKAPGELLSNFNKWRNKTADIISGDHSAGGIFSWVRASNDLVHPTYDIADFFTKAILYIPKKSIETLKGISAWSMVFGFTCLIGDSLQAINDTNLAEATGEKRNEKLTETVSTLIKLAERISYLGIGIILVLSVFFAIEVASVVSLSLSVATVSLSILGYYYENLGTEITTK